jgi:hypothetical protein
MSALVPTGAARASTAGEASAAAGLQGRVLWMDAYANLERLATRAGVAEAFARCRRANINTVVVDVKPLSGQVLYDSRLAPRLTSWQGRPGPADFDLLAAAVEEGERQGIRVHAGVNVFCEGHKLARAGPIYSRPEQQSIVNECARALIAPSGARLDLALGDNQPAGTGEVRVFTRSRRAPARLGRDEIALVLVDGLVTRVVDGSDPATGPLTFPSLGCLVVGSGAGAAWLRQHAPLGAQLVWEAAPRLVPITQSPSEEYGMFVIPTHPAARAYALQIVDEIVTKYPVDGIAFDRMRYASIRADFSDCSRAQFETWLGRKIQRWPNDIYEWDPLPGQPLRRGPLFNAWAEWRARNIRDWLAEAAAIVRARRPEAKIGAYVGSWYPEYYDVGVNWAADDYAAGYHWMTPNYPATGYARLLDYLTTGCYYRVPTRAHARRAGLPEEASVQAAAELSNRVVNNATFCYAGLYLLDYHGSPQLFREALAAAAKHSQGVMIFDMVYLDRYDWWGIVNQAFPEPKEAPHDRPGLLERVRQAHAANRTTVAAPPAAAADATGDSHED